MRWIYVCAVVAVTRTAAADCELSLDFHGALVDATFREHVAPSTAATALDYELPAGAHVVGFALRGKHGAGAAVAVPADPSVEEVRDGTVLGADPAFVIALPDSDAGRPHVRAIVEPIADGSDVVAQARWTMTADIRDGELRVRLPARAAGCKTTVHAQVGAGASVTRIRAGAAETRGATATFELADADLPVAVELAFARPEPIAWVQREPLGDGTSAQALTVIAPPTAQLARTHRAVLVIDTSRSMDFVGRDRVRDAVHAVVDALPPGSQIQAIAYDRTPANVTNGWQPAGAEALAALDAQLATRTGNGSDLGAALVLAHNAVGKDPATIVAITDGALGDTDAASLARSLGDPHAIDLHVIALDFADHAAPSRAVMLDAVDRVGGSYVELPVDERAKPAAWLEPAWFADCATLRVAARPGEAGACAFGQLRAGEGFVQLSVTRAPAAALAAHDEDGKVTITPHALAATEVALLTDKRPHVDAQHALAVLATGGKVAKDRHAMVAGGGPYTRMIAAADPPTERVAMAPPAPRRPASGLDRDLLQKLFELQLQPRAYQCYQHALAAQVAANKPPTLAGTARFSLELARGEVTRATVAGLGDAAFDACLLDAAYALAPPAPNADYDPDDRTLATYPLTFALRPGDKPIIVAGDADSSSPLDIDSIHGGVARPTPVRVDTVTPLGQLKPTP